MNKTQILGQIDSILASNFGNEKYTPGQERLKFWIGQYDLTPQGKILTICGTNGKGETTCAVGHLLSKYHKNYCSWTSPHIVEITERFVHNGEQITPKTLLEFMQVWLERLSTFRDRPLTYFEFLFIVFLDWQKSLKTDYLVLEVGLGGRLDAVNALEASVVVLTSISRDHQEFLGPTLKGILTEKLGVLRSTSELVANLELKYLRQLTSKYCSELGIVVEFIKDERLDFSKGNQHLALRAFNKLTGVDAEQGELNDFSYRARFTLELEQLKIDLFGSHNPDGLRKLVGYLNSGHYNNYDVVLLSFSKRDLKDLRTMIGVAGLLGKEIFISTFSHVKAVELQQLREIVSTEVKGRINFVTDFRQAIISNKEGPNHILVTGSYYFIGEVVSWLRSAGAK